MDIIITKEALVKLNEESIENGIRISAEIQRGCGIHWDFKMEDAKKKSEDKKYESNGHLFFINDYTKDIIGNKLILSYGKKTKFKIMNENETLGYYLDIFKK